MRFDGTVTQWNDDRGYGFVALPQSQEEIFVHISAFPRSGARPRIGESVSFEVRVGPDGSKRAECVMRPGGPVPTRERRNTGRKHRLVQQGLAMVAVGGLGVAAYLTAASRHETPGTTLTPTVSPQLGAVALEHFHCDGRTRCSQMSTCAEAVYFLEHCPKTELDEDHDGDPCEQWCNGGASRRDELSKRY